MREITAWSELRREWRSNAGFRIGTLLLVATLLGVVGGTYAIIEGDRAELAEKFEAERELQLAGVTALVESEFEDIHDDLELTAGLAYNVYPEQQQAIVMALLGAVRAYRAAALVDVEGNTKVISDPRSDQELSDEAHAAMFDAGRQAMEKGTYISPRVGGEDSWFRAFGQVVPSGDGAFVLLVDTRSFLDDLRVLSADPQTLVVVLGPQGRLARVTSDVVVRQVEQERQNRQLTELLAAMTASDHGSYRLRWKDATWTGFEPGDVVVAHRQISGMPGSRWAVATLTSLSVIRSHEAAVTTRLIWIATFVSLLLAGFGLYLIVTTRRTARLRERLRSASEVARLEAQLLRAEKLSTVGVLAAGIAHEIGTPLSVVRGRAEYILGKTEAESSNAKGLRVIIEQIDRVSRIIQELLDFSRVDVARTDGVNLRETLETVRELLRVELSTRQVSMQLDVPEGLPLLAADRDRLVQVLVNLIVNARDAMETTALPRVVKVSARAEEGGVRMEVRDTGTGIPADALNRIFDPFFSTKKRGQGTGLGLAVVSQIVRNHGGRVDVWSEPGVGTRFEIVWPQYLAREK